MGIGYIFSPLNNTIIFLNKNILFFLTIFCISSLYIYFLLNCNYFKVENAELAKQNMEKNMKEKEKDAREEINQLRNEVST